MPSHRPIVPSRPLAPRVRRPAPQAGFDLDALLDLLKARRPLIIKTMAAVMVLALLVALSLPVVYSSSAVVMLDGRKNNITDASAVLSQLQPDPATIQNQIQILESRELAEKVIADQRLTDDPEFNGALPQPGLAGLFDPKTWFGAPAGDIAGQHDKVVDNFLHHVWADANGLSTTITIAASSRDPMKAQRLANALAHAFVQDQVSGRHVAASQTSQYLQGRVNDLAAQLQTQNEDIQRFKAENGLADAGPGTSLVDQQMLGINSQIVQARSDLNQKEAEQKVLTNSDPATASAVVASPLITQLRTQQATLAQQEADLLQRYGPLHPKLVEVQAQRRDLDQKIATEIGRIAGSVSNEVAAARNHLQSLEGSLKQAEQLSVNQNMARSQLAALETNAASTRATYEAFVTRLRTAQDQDATLSPETRILSPAALPQSPSSPRRSLIVGASLPLGLMLGVLLALLEEKFGHLLRRKGRRGARRRPEPVPAVPKNWNGPPILGELNNAYSLRAADYVIDWPSSRFARASAALVRQLESRNGEGAVIALTTPDPGEARSVVAVAIARAAAAMDRRVVILDLDPAHRTTTALGANGPAGLYEVLTGSVALNDALVRDPRSGAFLLSLKQRPRETAAMFASPQMQRLLSILRDGCDLVILDCGQMRRGPDTALLARQADATLLVSPRKRMRARTLARVAESLQRAEAAPLGLVLAG